MNVSNAPGKTITASPTARRQPGDRAVNASKMLRGLATGLGISLLAPLPLTAPAQAEGSRDLSNSGGYRPYIEYRTASAGDVQRKTIIKVYAEAGETINLGSSAVNVGNGIINYTKPNGSTGNCGSVGKINNRSEEVNQSFTPCVVTVGAGETGVWEIDFVSPDQGSRTNPPEQLATAAWTQPAGVGYISAWDVTVKNGNTPISGRVYANYFAFNIGANVNNALSSKIVVLTDQGYRYRVDFNGLDPYGFILFSNNKGYRDGSGDAIFRSLQYVGDNPGNVPSGFSFQAPNDPDTSDDVTHKLFVNAPDPTMPSSASSPNGLTWLYQDPIAPPIPQNFEFVGEEGTSGQAGTSPLGGKFQFDNPGLDESSYSITLDINQNGTFGDGSDRTFLGTAAPGFNEVPWDGLDGNGAPIAPSNNDYGAQVNLYAGEAHFPMVDAENNPQGIIIERLNVPAGLSNADNFEVFYDDRNSGSSATDFSICANNEPPNGSSCYGNGPNPRAALTGVSSNGGAHRFSNLFGNIRGIDTWVYYPSTDVFLPGGITIKEADLVLLKTDNATDVDPGENLVYNITIENQGPSDVSDITFEDNLPTQLINATWTCTITTGNGNCDEASGSADTDNKISTTLDLEKDAIATYTITTTVDPATPSGVINNTGTVVRSDDVTDPDLTNNQDSDTTTVNVLLNLTLVKRITGIDGTAITSHIDDTSGPTADNDNHPHWPPGSNAAGISDFLAGAIDGSVSPGDELEYTVYFLSSGNFPLTNVNLCDWIPENTTYVANSAALFFNGSTTQASSQFLAAGNTPSVPCPTGSNTNGAVVVNVVDATTQLPAATGPGTPNDAYGYIRFRVTVD